jgi:hypothetical protein
MPRNRFHYFLAPVVVAAAALTMPRLSYAGDPVMTVWQGEEAVGGALMSNGQSVMPQPVPLQTPSYQLPPPAPAPRPAPAPAPYAYSYPAQPSYGGGQQLHLNQNLYTQQYHLAPPPPPPSPPVYSYHPPIYQAHPTFIIRR